MKLIAERLSFLKTNAVGWTLLFLICSVAAFRNVYMYAAIFIILILLITILIDLIWNIILLVSPSENNFEDTRIAKSKVFACCLFLISIYPAGHLGNFINREIFLMELPRYEQAVEQITSQHALKAPVKYEAIDLPESYADLSYFGNVGIMPDTDKSFIILFMEFNYGFPPRARGYIYQTSDDISTDLEKKFYLKKLAPHWYAFNNK